jgi:SPP1 family holin
MEKFKIKGETIARTIALIFVLINTVLTAIGLNPLPYSETEVYEAISTVVTVIIALWAWWKDNDITQKALARKAKLAELEAEE